ncbi:hypothetical protein B0H13DRAFT_2549726 [Mycena leptocephala]|nr:hypothetical protein B0H13DRAFT_2549726 [Mycena leptocephala]
MVAPRFTISTTVFSDSESEDDELLPRTEPMRHDSTVQVGGRVRHSTWYITVEASPGKRKRNHTPEPDYLVPDVAQDFEDFGTSSSEVVPSEDFFAFDEGHPVETGPRQARESDRPLNIWAEDDLEDFLDAVVRGEGRGDYVTQLRCGECRTVDSPAHRCEDCFTDALVCGGCMVRLHADNPFHVIKMWNGHFFVDTTLRELGLRVQLGHKRGEKKKATETSFCIVDTNAIHEVALDFCTCGTAPPPTIQLLCAHLYPATTLRPSTAATFRMLRKFHKLSFESKCSAYEFYNALARETDNTGNFQPRNRYREFLRMTREWWHLQMLKWSGRAHIPGGARNIEAGACAVLCPACPQPGKNLPVGGEWRSAPPEKKFLYALFLAIDANFRMKRKQVSSEEADPGLNLGSAFFSDIKAYMQHVGEHWEEEQEKSRCVSHDAVNQPDKEARGTASSGIGTVDCARHNMKRPNGVGDLQKGEWYINMDYMLWKSLQGYDDLVQLVVSYDIVCQWRINIWRRLEKYKPELQECSRTGERRYIWLIPKFHLPAHIEACNILYSFNLTPYVGRTDGKAPERGWANANPLASSTKEMGPGAWRDVLDNHFNDWNHKKIIALGRVMLERVQKAVAKMGETQEEFVESEASLPTESVKAWTTAMELWEADPKQPNPFDVQDKHVSLQAVRGRIATETKDAVEGDAADDLEEQQRELASDTAALKTHASDGQKTTILERGNKLRWKIASWIQTQTEFQPGVAVLREAAAQARAWAAKMQPTSGVPVEAIELWLPSKQARTPGVTFKESHGRHEFDMREARAYEVLDELRRLLLVRTHHYKFKDVHVHGVGAQTRARTAIEVLDERIRRTAKEYRATRQALASLAPTLAETSWELKLKPLEAKDIRGMPRALFADAEKKKKKKRARQEEDGVNERGGSDEGNGRESAGRVGEDAGAAHQWTEEVDLLEEEMRRILVFVEWKGQWWRQMKDGRPDVTEDATAREGFNVYAERQAVIQETLKTRFERDWEYVPEWISLGRRGVVDFKTRADADDDDDEEEVETDPESYEPVPVLARNAAVVSASLVEGSLLPASVDGFGFVGLSVRFPPRSLAELSLSSTSLPPLIIAPTVLPSLFSSSGHKITPSFAIPHAAHSSAAQAVTMSRCIEPRCSQSSTNENAHPCRTLRACCPTATSSSLETHRRTPSLRSLPLRGLAPLTAYILYPLPAHRDRLQHSPSPLPETYMPDATHKLEFPPFLFRMAPRDHIEHSILVPRRPRSTAFPTHSR